MRPFVKKIGIIGNPLDHSLSPQIHNNWIKLYKLNYTYLAYPMKSLEGLIQKIKDDKIFGLNVTLPFKQEVFQYIDEIDTTAQAINAINTIKIVEDKLIGYNTDVNGIEISIGRQLETINSMLIIGAGGAAQSIAYIANKKQIRTDILNRTKSNAEILANRFTLNAVNQTEVFNRNYDLIVNASSVGLKQNETPIDLKLFKENPKYVFDMIYNPTKTKLLETATELGIPNQNGMAMLINQAKESFRIWTGLFPE